MKSANLRILAAIIILSLFAGSFLMGRSDAGGRTRSTADDLRLLTQLSAAWMERIDLLVIKHSGAGPSYKELAEFRELAEQGSRALGLPVQPVMIAENGRFNYATSVTDQGGRSRSLALTGADGRAYIVVESRWRHPFKLEASAGDWLQLAEHWLKRIGVAPQWTMNAQGMSAANVDSADLAPNDLPPVGINASLVESYADGGTVSRTYYAREIQATASSGGRKVNLQTSLQHLTGGEKPRVTIGIPLITIEY
jgi:hypothetical protein